ncbi:MAG: zinc-dependent alcohol dehydrogenase family protein [Verrucomicrobia bacterium]|nr:zinc-dependent alcohol dehydrogenase family protein [Verrucomicrobiota bacterium]
MRAMVLRQPKTALVLEEIPKPKPQENELLIRVKACGVCRTDLHVQEGDLPSPKLPLILGHEIVGVVEEVGKQTPGFKKGDRVGVPWLGSTCGQCEYCIENQENLCDQGCYTGYQINGGFAEYTVCKADYAISLPKTLSDEQMAPLLCAGLIGYRAYRKAAPQKTLGLYGFGAAAHLLTQIATQEGKEVYAFTREGDLDGQAFARKLGAVWAGDSSASPPVLLDAVIIFAPVGELVPQSLKVLKKGGRCICGGIHMSDIPSFPYRDLWAEKRIESVANLSRKDAKEFFALLPKLSVYPQVTAYPLEKANQALADLKAGKFQGAAVLRL